MNDQESSLGCPPWTPHLDQGHFEVISPLELDTLGSIASNLNFNTLDNPLFSPQASQLNDIRSQQHGHKRYLSFPLASLSSKTVSTSHSHSRAMSCMTSFEGLGISFFDDWTAAENTKATSDDPVPTTPSSDSSSAMTIKEEEQEHPSPHGHKSSSDDALVKPERPLTAAEMRAEKRKMKRFRLTHQQTRYLMSEFARQAHPDAAHREKLSRAIPGLSSRQVQVWFQNRYVFEVNVCCKAHTDH